jgi:hypothetical protein
MNATLGSAPVGSPRTASSRYPVVEREDIVFHSPRPGRLLVDVTFRNPSHFSTEATVAVLRSAPLGAFVAWQPLGYLQVPPLVPGESAVIRSEFEYEAPETLGGIDRLPPERVLTALGSEEPGRRRRQARPLSNPPLATDLLALLSSGSAHWAGNLNIFFPGVDVERHVAQALRVYPGRVNLAAFIVGNTRDRYQFHLDGNVDWNARLFDTCPGIVIVAGSALPQLSQGQWYRPLSGFLMLSVEPPADAETGAVNVHIRQQSTQREAVVEFTMDSRAAGPGCFKL